MSCKSHYPIDGTSDETIAASLCGHHTVMVVVDRDSVTCVRCSSLLKKRESRGRRAVGMEEAVREVLHVLAGPPVEEYPALTPDLWRQMRCIQGKQCYCPLCLIDEANVRAKQTWEAEQTIRPHLTHEHVFGSVNAALELLLRFTQDGASARSSQGSMQDRAEETMRLGTAVQTTARYDRDPIEIRRATYATDISRMVRKTFAQEQERRGLTVEQCTCILLSTVDAQQRVSVSDWAEVTGLSERSIQSLIAHGRRVMASLLHEAGYVPKPRERRV